MIESASIGLLVFILILFILILAGLLGLYLHITGFTLVEVILLVAFPLFAYFAALSVVGSTINGLTGGIFGTVLATGKGFDVPIFNFGRIVIGANAVGFLIP